MTITTQADLEAEVNDLIEYGINAGQSMPASWITQEVLRRHPVVDFPEKDFYVMGASHHVRDTVRHRLRLYKERRDETPEQLRFEDFDYLQKAYLIEREGEQTIVPLKNCTCTELTEKIAELRRMGDGCYKHADEIHRFMESSGAL